MHYLKLGANCRILPGNQSKLVPVPILFIAPSDSECKNCISYVVTDATCFNFVLGI